MRCPARPRPAGPRAGSSRWRPARSCSLISLALIAGGAILICADTEQVHSGYLTTTTATYSTRGYALASDAITRHSQGLFVDGSGSGLPRPTRPPAVRGHRRHRRRGALPERCQLHDGGGAQCRRPPGHRGPGGSGRCAALGRAGPGDREPDPHLGGPGRRLDGGGDERRRPPGVVRADRSGDIGHGAAVAGR